MGEPAGTVGLDVFARLMRGSESSPVLEQFGQCAAGVFWSVRFDVKQPVLGRGNNRGVHESAGGGNSEIIQRVVVPDAPDRSKHDGRSAQKNDQEPTPERVVSSR
jgi:hypothetical protein